MSMTRALAIDESEHGVRVNRCVFLSLFVILSLSMYRANFVAKGSAQPVFLFRVLGLGGYVYG